MADAKKPEAEAAPAPPKGKKKLMLFIIIGVVLALLAGGGAFYMLKTKDAAADEHASEGAPREVERKPRVEQGEPPAYYKFEKAFTVRLQSEQQDAYLQTEVQFKLESSHDQDLMKQFEPELKHRITLTLMGKHAADLGTADGVQRLANELRDVANRVVGAPPPKKRRPGTEQVPADTAEPGDPVQSVLFSTFIVQ